MPEVLRAGVKHRFAAVTAAVGRQRLSAVVKPPVAMSQAGEAVQRCSPLVAAVLGESDGCHGHCRLWYPKRSKHSP